jgi:hypothetical protein
MTSKGAGNWLVIYEYGDSDELYIKMRISNGRAVPLD